MKVSDIILEANRNKIILVDFQPAYNGGGFGHDDALRQTTEDLNKMKPTEVLVFYNGEDVGIEDTAEEVIEMYIEYGLVRCILNMAWMNPLHTTCNFVKNPMLGCVILWTLTWMLPLLLQ